MLQMANIAGAKTMYITVDHFLPYTAPLFPSLYTRTFIHLCMSSCDKETVQDCLCITNTVVEVLASTLQTTPHKSSY